MLKQYRDIGVGTRVGWRRYDRNDLDQVVEWGIADMAANKMGFKAVGTFLNVMEESDKPLGHESVISLDWWILIKCWSGAGLLHRCRLINSMWAMTETHC